MESLAALVMGMLIAELVLCLVVITAALVYRFTGRFRRTALTLIVVLAIGGGWLFGNSWQLGLPSVVALIASILFVYIPNIRKK